MGLFDSYRRPCKIQILDVENQGSAAIIAYKATYSDGTVKSCRKNVKYLFSSSVYAKNPTVQGVECLGKVYIGIIKSDVRYLFLVSLSDKTVDIVQEKQGTARCSEMLSRSLDEEGSFGEEKTAAPAIRFEGKKKRFVEDLDIPIEILPNLYSLSLSNIALKHHLCDDLNYLTLKCKVNFCLNGRKEGKRYILFTSYDDKGGVVEIKGDYKKVHFTEAGYEFVDICFDDYGNRPISKISVSVREI